MIAHRHIIGQEAIQMLNNAC